MGYVTGDSVVTSGGPVETLGLTLPTIAGSNLRLAGSLIIAGSVTGLAITVNGSPVSIESTSPSANGRNLILFDFAGPATGHVLSCDWTGAVIAWLAYQVFSDVVSVRDALTDAGVSAASPLALGLTTVAADNCADFCAASFATMTIGAGQTTGFTEVSQNAMPYNGSYEIASGTTTTMSWGIDAVGEWFYHGAIAYVPAGGGGGPNAGVKRRNFREQLLNAGFP